MPKRRKNGEGSWGEKTIKGVKYQYYRNPDGRYTYGKTIKEVKLKLEEKAKKQITNKSTFGEYLLWYHNEIHKLSIEETTYSTYISVINTIKECKEYYDIWNVRMDMFSKNQNYLQRYINAITPYYALNTIKGQWRVIKPALLYAEEKGMIEPGCSIIKLPKEENAGHKKKNVPFLTKEYALKMYNELDSKYTSSGRNKYVPNGWGILLIIHTGLRIGEFRALKWNDIDFDKKEMLVDESVGRIKKDDKYQMKIKSTKNISSKRIIPLNSIALEMLRKYETLNPNHKPEDFVCVNKKNHTIVSAQKMQQTLNSMIKNIGDESIQHCNLHGLRHTFGSILFEQKVDLKTISTLMGHSSITTTANIYIGITKKTLTDATKALEPELPNCNNES